MKRLVYSNLSVFFGVGTQTDIEGCHAKTDVKVRHQCLLLKQPSSLAGFPKGTHYDDLQKRLLRKTHF